MSDHDLGGQPMRQLPIETASLTLRSFVPEDVPKAFQMSQEDGMRTWLPSQVYRDEAHAARVLASLISQFSVPGDPKMGAYVLAVNIRRRFRSSREPGIHRCEQRHAHLRCKRREREQGDHAAALLKGIPLMSERCRAYFVSLTSAVDRPANGRSRMQEEMADADERAHQG